MESWLLIPLPLRLLMLFVAGVLVGGQVNRGVYRLAWEPRYIGPWSPPHKKAPPRRWSDRLPIVGWWGLRREAAIHGRGYWVRPMLLELAFGIGYAWLYWWEIDGRLLPAAVIPPYPPRDIHAQYLSHLVLLTLMAVATFIDFDEKTIPDAITVPGLLLGLLLAAVLPISHLPVIRILPTEALPIVESLRLTSPAPWPGELSREPHWLATASACTWRGAWP